MRRLATIRRIAGLDDIAGADRILSARIAGTGWRCVVGKGQFDEGDLGVYFEIDSLLPCVPTFDVLNLKKRINADNSVGYRIKTMKIRGSLSQGLLMQMDMFPEIQGAAEGQDVTMELGVRLYEPPDPADLASSFKGEYPAFIEKSDQDRIQILPDHFTRYAEAVFEESVKLDGSSCTFYLNDGVFGVCIGRRYELKETEFNKGWMLARTLKVEEILRKSNMNLALQGELIGKGIQGNNEKLENQQFFLYNIYDIDKKRFMTPVERIATLDVLNDTASTLGTRIDHVPILGKVAIFQECPDVDSILARADGSSLYSDTREGLVYKSVDMFDGKVVQFKAISNKYLLGQEN